MCSGTNNMYWKYWDLTTGVPSPSAMETPPSPHIPQAYSTQVMKVKEVPASKCHPLEVNQFHDSKVKFPLPHLVLPQHKPGLTPKKPNIF